MEPILVPLVCGTQHWSADQMQSLQLGLGLEEIEERLASDANSSFPACSSDERRA